MSDDIDFDFGGINPKEIFSRKDYETKSNINIRQAVSLSVIHACQNYDFDHDVLDLFSERFLILCRSVGGAGMINYVDSVKARIQAEDRKTNIRIDKESE